MEFNRNEIKDFIISVLTISIILILSDLFAGNQWIGNFIIAIIVSFISLIIKILVHKKIGERFDCNATYSFNYNLFIIALLIGLLTNGGIIFAAIGSVIISSIPYSRIGHKYVNITTREAGLISLSGSLANIILALVSLIVYPVMPGFFQPLFRINVYMALFNMIPLPPLDGSKVFWWSRIIWFTMFVIPLFMFFFGFSTLFTLLGILLLIFIVFLLWQKIF